MKIYVYPSKEKLAEAAAAMIAGLVIEKPDAILGLATGDTPVPTYKEMARLNREGVVSFADMRTFNLDEYAGIAPDHPQSYRRFMNEQLFNHIDINLENTRVPSGFADAEGAAEYDMEIEAAGGVDLQVLGIGRNGHIGFNEPAEAYPDCTSIITLTESTIDANKRFFDSADEVPRKAISMGVGTIMRARKALLIATGADKADAVCTLVKGAVSPNLPASALRMHPNAIIVLDEEAASKL